MEPKSNSVIIAIANNKGPGPSPSPSPVHEIVPRHDEKSTDDHVGAATPTAADVAAAVNNYKKKRSGGGAMHILQVAMFMLRRRRSSGKSKSVSLKGDQALASSKGAWKRLVGSIRPLHLQSSSPMNGSVDLSVTSSERYEDVLPPPMSPARTDDLASEDGMTSRYASAVNLQELDRPEGDATNGPASGEQNVNIDAKAEEFIAQFYQQMRLQRSDSINV